MVDVQNHHDDRNIPIEQVGVSDLRYPIIVLDRKNDKQQTVANIAMSVNLPHSNVAFRLKSDPRTAWYRVKSVNHESIHNHCAFAVITCHEPSPQP
jgi:GTP cyclohydrolase FolE2